MRRDQLAIMMNRSTHDNEESVHPLSRQGEGQPPAAAGGRERSRYGAAADAGGDGVYAGGRGVAAGGAAPAGGGGPGDSGLPGAPYLPGALRRVSLLQCLGGPGG